MMQTIQSIRPFDTPLTRTLVAAALLALTGCAVGPDYQRPEASLPDSYRATQTTPGMQEAITVEKAWWRRFQDDTLNALVDRALAHNYDLLAAVARVEEAEGLARQAGATFFPQINLNGSGTHNQVSTMNTVPLSSSAPRIQDSRKAGLSTSFAIDLWGKLRRADEPARASLLASRYARDAMELSVAGLVTSSYLSLRAADASLLLTENTLDSRRKTLEIVNNKHQAGSASPLDQNLAEGSLAVAEAQVADLRRQRTLAQNQLALLTGQPNLDITAGDLRKLPMPPVPPPGLPSALLEARPDVRQAEETLVSYNAQIGVAKAALFPSLSLTGNYGGESAALSNLFKSGANVWSIGLAATMPLFDFGRNAALIDQAKAKQQQALIAYQKAIESAFKDVKDALVNLSEYAESDRAQEKRVQIAGRTLELAQIRYEAGYVGFLDVLDAQRSSNDALLAYISTRQARLNSTVDLFKALGGGWRDEYKPETPVAMDASTPK